MAHTLACSLSQLRRIVEVCPAEEADVHVRLEGVYVSESDIAYARNRAAIVY
jgi:hypothetical protein